MTVKQHSNKLHNPFIEVAVDVFDQVGVTGLQGHREKADLQSKRQTASLFIEEKNFIVLLGDLLPAVPP
eukprot:1159212-Pelagomonas_calceolata.AAC.5